MKRFFSVLLCVLILSASAAAADHADVTSLAKLQDYIYSFSPKAVEADSWGGVTVQLSGTVLTAYQVENNHWELLVAVDDPDAMTPIGADAPVFRAHFRLHLDACPFAAGDPVTVFGTLNILYSSTMVPVILAKTINGSDDF